MGIDVLSRRFLDYLKSYGLNKSTAMIPGRPDSVSLSPQMSSEDARFPNVKNGKIHTPNNNALLRTAYEGRACVTLLKPTRGKLCFV